MPPIAKLSKKDSQKYFQTLQGHAEDALKILNAYVERNSSVIDQFCQRWGLQKSDFVKSLFVSVYLHDIGKLTQQFQENIKNDRTSQKYPHALYAFYLLKDLRIPRLIDIPIELAAILGHHTQLYNGIYDCVRDFGTPKFLGNELLGFIDGITNTYTTLGFDSHFDLPTFEIKEIPRYRVNKLALARKALINQVNNYPDKAKLKSIFTYYFSILQICDDYSSAAFSDFIERYPGAKTFFDSIIEDPSPFVPLLKVENPMEKVLVSNTPYPYQEEIHENATPNSLLFAPCGRGKTEAALLWALKILETCNRNKIIFAMPTQTTSNAMYDRMCNLFGKDNVGLFHGRSYIKLKSDKKEETPELEEKDVEEIKGETFKGNVFFKPITITTIDHLIYSFIHGFTQADFALGNAQNAVLIFDEVHYYEKTTLEHLLTLFKILNEMSIPHLLMSGTLPEFLKKEVKLFGEYSVFEDSEGLRFRPFFLRFENEPLIGNIANSEVLEEIKTNYTKGLNQFIILNTVERAKKFYKDLVSFIGSDDSILLYHSQFTFNDRVKKENDIMEGVKKNPFILVATQVIEVSLDISCDVMYTELAPPDALGQRAGRLNRKGRIPNNGIVHELKIFPSSRELPYSQNLIGKSLTHLNKFLKACSYKDIKEFCDLVYGDYLLQTPSNLKYVFRNCTIFGHSPYDISFGEEEGKIIQVREQRMQKIEVIPEDIFKEFGKSAPSIENQAKVPLWWLKGEIKEFDESVHFYEKENAKGKSFRICTYPYNYSIGFEYGKEKPPSNIL